MVAVLSYILNQPAVPLAKPFPDQIASSGFDNTPAFVLSKFKPFVGIPGVKFLLDRVILTSFDPISASSALIGCDPENTSITPFLKISDTLPPEAPARIILSPALTVVRLPEETSIIPSLTDKISRVLLLLGVAEPEIVIFPLTIKPARLFPESRIWSCPSKPPPELKEIVLDAIRFIASAFPT